MFSSVRQAAFKFVGGFALADLYSAAVRQSVGDDAPQVPPKSSWFSRRAPPPPTPLRRFEDDTLRGDLDWWIEENQLSALVAFGLCLLGGGPFALAGAAASVAFDGEAGDERYLALRDEVEGLWGGHEEPPISR